MKLTLYDVSDADNIINKELNIGLEIDIILKSDCNIDNLIIPLKTMTDFNRFNYAHIDGLNRFYFIDYVSQINNEITSLNLTCDVLETYKNDILNSLARFKRPIKHGDYVDVNMEKQINTTSEIFKSNKTIDNNSKTLILSVTGYYNG